VLRSGRPSSTACLSPSPQALRVSMEEQRQRQEEEARRAAAASAAEAGIAATGGDGAELGWERSGQGREGEGSARWGSGCCGAPGAAGPSSAHDGAALVLVPQGAALPWPLPWRGRMCEGKGIAGTAPGLAAERGLCLRRLGRRSAEDDDNAAGVWPRWAARPQQHDGGGADRLRHADVAAGRG